MTSMQENDSIQGIVNTIKKKKGDDGGGVQTAGRQAYSQEGGGESGKKSALPEGSNEDLHAMTPEKAQEFLSAIENAMQKGKKEVEFEGKRWAVSSNLVQAIQGKVAGGGSDGGGKGGVSSAQSSHQVASSRRGSSPPIRPPARPGVPSRRP